MFKKHLSWVAAAGLAFGLAACTAEEDTTAQAPETEAQVENDVASASGDVEMGTQEETVTMPDVDVGTQEETLTTPDVDVDTQGNIEGEGDNRG